MTFSARWHFNSVRPHSYMNFMTSQNSMRTSAVSLVVFFCGSAVSWTFFFLCAWLGSWPYFTPRPVPFHGNLFLCVWVVSWASFSLCVHCFLGIFFSVQLLRFSGIFFFVSESFLGNIFLCISVAS